MSLPKISVIIPAYNAENFITNAIESALAQTTPAHEIIVIDDGSMDKTIEVASRFIPGIRLLTRENGGPAAARNLGIRNSTGEWLAMLDADDTWLPNKLEIQTPFTFDPKVGIVHGYENQEDEAPPCDLNFDKLWKKNWISNTTALVRKKAYEQVGGLDESRALISVEDYNLWLRIAHVGWKIETIREKLVNYTPTPNSLSRQTERFASAEFANVASLKTRLKLSKEVVVQKRIALSEQYGRDLLYYRNLSAARKMLAFPLLNQPTPKRFGWWLATFLPVSVLNYKRTKSQPS